MSQIYFHDLPVYRLSEEDYYKSREAKIAASIANTERGITPSPEVRKHIADMIKQHDYDKYGPWQFNEIIGYVRLHFLGSQVRGEYFSVKRGRVVFTRQKTLIYRTHKLAPEHQVPRGATNEQILLAILGYVKDCRKEEPRRFFDDSWLRTIGPMVDWNAIMYPGRRRST